MLARVIGARRDFRGLQERSLRVDAVLRMSTPPAHLSGRTLLPGGLLAVLVACAALFALAVVIVVSPDGPVRLWLDGGGSATSLRPGADGSAGALPSGPVSLLPGGTISGRTGEVTLATPERPGTVRLRANTRVQRRSARTPAASSPNRTAPAATPSPLQPVPRAPSTSGPAPVASPAPGSTVDKQRSSPTSPTTADVPKERVASRSTPAPTSATSSPEDRSAPAPAPEPQRAPSPAPQDTGAGVLDGALQRVPPP
jgi:hypothetical protein